jgi:hypothetical protein
MMKRIVTYVGNCQCEALVDKDRFVGLGRVWIGKTLVRSGRLPLRPYAQTFTGLELAGVRLLGVRSGRIELEAQFRKMPVKVIRDHSFDPIHELGDWDQDRLAGVGRLDLVLSAVCDKFHGVGFSGFSYHWEYRSKDVPLYWLMDRASWELDGDITGATVVSQSSCSAPVVKFDRRNAWSTEGILFFLAEKGNANAVMTHNLPRWASHGSFDFQYKGDRTLIGVFDRVELIRSVLCREAGQPELKHFDKHIFDQALDVKTTAKRVMLSTETKSEVGQQNVWTWIHEEVESRARAEFGLKQEPLLPTISLNYWHGFTADSYFKDLIPAAAAVGCRKVFVDNLKKSAMTDRTPFRERFTWNMCCGHEYEIAPELGGNAGVKRLVARAKALGVTVQSWTNNAQAISSPMNQAERDQGEGLYVLLEDTRQKYGGGLRRLSKRARSEQFESAGVLRAFASAYQTGDGLELVSVRQFLQSWFHARDVLQADAAHHVARAATGSQGTAEPWRSFHYRVLRSVRRSAAWASVFVQLRHDLRLLSGRPGQRLQHGTDCRAT